MPLEKWLNKHVFIACIYSRYFFMFEEVVGVKTRLKNELDIFEAVYSTVAELELEPLLFG
jgi:hypothetical protein